MRLAFFLIVLLVPGLSTYGALVDMGVADEIDGLENSHTSPADGGDGENEAVNCGPVDDVRDCRKNWGDEDPTPDGPQGDQHYPDGIFYFNVLDPDVKSASRLSIDITLYDDASAAGTEVLLHYTNDKATAPSDIPNVFFLHPTQYVLEGTDKWITLSWKINDAGFQSFQQGDSDFRIWIGGNKRLCVDLAEVNVVIPEFPYNVTCEGDENLNVNLTWEMADTFDQIKIIRDGDQVAQLAGDVMEYMDPKVPTGRHTYQVLGKKGDLEDGETCLIALYSGLEGVIASVDLGEEDDENGLENSQTGPGDGENEPVLCGPAGDEQQARSNWSDQDPSQDYAGGVWPDSLIYFNVTDPVIKKWSHFKIRLTLWDDPAASGTGIFLQYTNWDSQGPSDIPNTFYPLDNPPTQTLSGTDEWITLEWDIEDAGFQSFQQGTSDFRFGLTSQSIRLCFDKCEIEAVIPDYPTHFTCAQEDNEVLLSWEVNIEYTEITIERNGETIAQLAGDETTFTDAEPSTGMNLYTLEGHFLNGSGITECSALVTGEIGPEEPFDDPPGGWDYVYDPSPTDSRDTMGQYVETYGASGNLDGGWIRSLDSDQWDGSSFEEVAANPPGDAPGGIDILSLQGSGYDGEDIGVLSMEDTGDPTAWPQPNNSKFYLCYPLRQIIDDDLTRSILSDGATLCVRFRVKPIPYSAEILPPDGYRNYFGGKGFISICHRSDIAGTLVGNQDFGLSIDADPADPSHGVLYLGVEPVAIPLDMAPRFLTLWITINDDDEDPLTPEHHVTIWANGTTDVVWEDLNWTFDGSGVESLGALDTQNNPPINYLAIGIPSTPETAAMELDFIKFREGVVEPGTVITELFKRGDVNADGSLNLADAISLLSYLFSDGSLPSCPDAADSNDDGKLNLADAIGILSYLFAGAGDLPPPFSECGPDPSDNDTLGTCAFAPCQ